MGRFHFLPSAAENEIHPLNIDLPWTPDAILDPAETTIGARDSLLQDSVMREIR